MLTDLSHDQLFTYYTSKQIYVCMHNRITKSSTNVWHIKMKMIEMEYMEGLTKVIILICMYLPLKRMDSKMITISKFFFLQDNIILLYIHSYKIPPQYKKCQKNISLRLCLTSLKNKEEKNTIKNQGRQNKIDEQKNLSVR